MTNAAGVDRRTFLVRAGVVGGVLLTLPTRRGWAATPDVVVETRSGKIRGVAADGISAFRGIPYGASTQGANRFMPPLPPVAWGGVRDAVDWAGHAPQAFFGQRRPEVSALSGEPDKVPVSEDCLTLNVWTPGLDSEKRPVLV
jgi:para-nitrobenzyl esterase